MSKNTHGILEQFSHSPSEMSMFFKGFAADLVDIFAALSLHTIYIRTRRDESNRIVEFCFIFKEANCQERSHN